MSRTVLVLNADYTPLRVIPWQRAIGLLLDDKASLVEAYTGHVIRSATTSLPYPAVVALNRYSQFRNRVAVQPCQRAGPRCLRLSVLRDSPAAAQRPARIWPS